MKIAVILITILLATPVISDKFWNSNTEKFHNVMREWWDIDAFIHADKNYSITSSFEYEKETPASNLFLTIFDLDENKFYDMGSYGDNIPNMKYENGYIKYKNCWIKPSYPNYKAYFEKKNKKIYIEMQAEAPPTEVAEGISNYLPVGLGYYKYTFTSKCITRGWIEIDGERKEFTGIAYYEHVWGNWSYNNPLKEFSFVTLKNYMRLFKWWINDMNFDYKNFTISTDNPFGYDWSWGFFDNGWTIFFGDIPFWIRGIPLGIIYIYNGKNYMEFKVTGCEYLDGSYIDGAFFPRELKITASGNKNLTLFFKMTHKPHIYKDNLSSPYWKELMLYECPGKIHGFYEKNELNGIGEIEVERQINIITYMLFKIFCSLNIYKTWIFP